MWKLISIHSTNLCAFKELDYTLTQGCTTLVFGNNLDNESQLSNGSGKSALIEAIAIGLTGDTLRKVKIDEIINDAADEATVDVTLANDFSNQRVEIVRTIYRKKPQTVKLFVGEGNGDAGDMTEDVQASVLEYNKHILDIIGLSKEDVFANFILSKHKYSSFLSSSDREKKEIINRFSNGIMVDESITALQADMEPVAEKLTQAEMQVAQYEGRVSAVKEQIASYIQDTETREQNKQERIKSLQEKIAATRASIRETEREIDTNMDLLQSDDAAYATLEHYELADSNAHEAYQNIVALFTIHGYTPIADYSANMKAAEAKLQSLSKAMHDNADKLPAIEASYLQAKQCLEQEQALLDDFNASFDEDYTAIQNNIQQLRDEVRKLQSTNAELQRQQNRISNSIADVEKQLAGAITCPQCGHEFILNAGDSDVQELRSQRDRFASEYQAAKETMQDIQEDIAEKIEAGKAAAQKRDDMATSRAEWTMRITNARNKVDEAYRQCTWIKNNSNTLQEQIQTCADNISSCRKRMFDEAFDILDRNSKNIEDKVARLKNAISTAKGSILSIEETITDLQQENGESMLTSLQENQAKYEAALSQAISDKESIERELATLKTQESTFVEFKTHLANSKIEALSHATNEFLERIGSDIRIAFSGFTMLKSGKIRDKISISLLRDGVDCGSYDKFSEGEKARANLANILALHKLTNVHAEEGKGLDLLILDEILEACDETGLANMFEALNSLGVTSLVVSHGNVAENYPHKLIVTKKNGISFING